MDVRWKIWRLHLSSGTTLFMQGGEGGGGGGEDRQKQILGDEFRFFPTL